MIYFILKKVCGALSDGRNRSPREKDHCDCPEGWEGINCNGKFSFLKKKLSCLSKHSRFI